MASPCDEGSLLSPCQRWVYWGIVIDEDGRFVDEPNHSVAVAEVSSSGSLGNDDQLLDLQEPLKFQASSACFQVRFSL